MAFANNYFANVGEVKDGSARIFTSYKNKDGKFVNDFNGYVQFVGAAKEKAADLKAGDKIQLKSVSVSNSYNKETGETRYYCKVLSFEKVEKEEKADE